MQVAQLALVLGREVRVVGELAVDVPNGGVGRVEGIEDAIEIGGHRRGDASIAATVTLPLRHGGERQAQSPTRLQVCASPRRPYAGVAAPPMPNSDDSPPEREAPTLVAKIQRMLDLAPHIGVDRDAMAASHAGSWLARPSARTSRRHAGDRSWTR